MGKIIYILSVGHSGSNMVGLMLGSHPDAACIGEASGQFSRKYNKAKNLDVRLPCLLCGKDCEYWAQLEDGKPFMDQLFKIFGKSILVDTSKKQAWISDTAEQHEHYIIHLTRNVYDVMGSYKNSGGNFRPKLDAWVKKEKRIREYVKDKPVIQVRYEDVCEGHGLQTCCTFASIEYYPEMRRYWEKEHHCWGSKTPHKVTDVKLVKRAHLLTNKEKNLIHKEAGKINRRLGYG